MPIVIVQSDSQAVGFSNRIAMVGLAAGAVALFVIALLARRAGAIEDSGPLISVQSAPIEDSASPWVTRASIVVTLLTVFIVGSLMRNYPSGDAGYFVDRLMRVASGGAPYSQVEFTYGPLLVYPQVATWRLLQWTGVSMYSVYYCWVGLFQALGLAFTTYLVNRLQLSRALRNGALLIVAGFTLLQPTLGLNYTAFRFLLPYVLFVWVMKRLTASPRGIEQRILPVFAVGLAAGVSPELAIALFFALTVSLVCLATRNVRLHISTLLILWFAALASSIVLSVSGGGTFGAFAGGACYLPVFPSMPALFFVSTMLLFGWGMGSASNADATSDSALHVGWFAVAVVLIAPALGRADFGHLFWNGLGAILACAAVLRQRWNRAEVYLGITAAVFLGAMLIYFGVSFRPMLIEAGLRTVVTSSAQAGSLSRSVGKPAEVGVRRWDELGATTKSDRLAASSLSALPALWFPEFLQGELGSQLAMSGHLIPSYCQPSAIPDENGFQILAGELTVVDTLTLPTRSLESYVAATAGAMPDSDGLVMRVPTTVGSRTQNGVLLGFPIALSGRREVFDPAASFGLLLARDWVPSGRVGQYTMLKRR